MQYAVQNVLFHADNAAFYVPQDSFLNNFPLDEWVHIANACGSYQIRRHSPGVSLFYISGENGHTRLIEGCRNLDAWVRLSMQRYQFPALAAFANGYKDTLRVFSDPSKADSLEGIARDPGFGKVSSQLRDKDDTLRWALKNGNLVLAGLLMTTCADQGLFPLTALGREQDFPLFAAHQRAWTVVRELLERGFDVNAQGGDYGDVLQAASAAGHSETAEQLLERGADVHARGGACGNAFQAASAAGHSEIIKQLLERGADVNTQGGLYGNALQAAIEIGHGEIVEKLLERGADVNIQGGAYGSALQAAIEMNHGEIVEQLLKRSADVNARGGQYGNALQAASHRGQCEIVKQLLERGANVDAQGGLYGSALQAASAEGYSETVKQLLERGANVNSWGSLYGNALQAALEIGHGEIVKQLL